MVDFGAFEAGGWPSEHIEGLCDSACFTEMRLWGGGACKCGICGVRRIERGGRLGRAGWEVGGWPLFLRSALFVAGWGVGVSQLCVSSRRQDSPNPVGVKGSKASAEPSMCLIPSATSPRDAEGARRGGQHHRTRREA